MGMGKNRNGSCIFNGKTLFINYPSGFFVSRSSFLLIKNIPIKTRIPPIISPTVNDSPKKIKANKATVIGFASIVGDTIVADKCPRA